MVVTSRPTTSETEVMQARVACLSTSTVHAPHSATPQPNFVPVNPTSSRRNQSSERSGSPSQFCSWPLIISLIMTWSSLFISCQCLFRREREHISLTAQRRRFIVSCAVLRNTDLPVSVSSPVCFCFVRWIPLGEMEILNRGYPKTPCSSPSQGVVLH